jgi:polyisoprenoid-binding protein YceI
MTTPDTTTADLSTLTGTWTLDPAHTTITFLTKAMWVLKVNGTLQATSGSGSVAPDGTVTGTIVFDAASISTKNKKRDAHLRTDEFFDVATYPTMTFTATGARPEGSGQVRVDGELTIRDQTRPLTLLAEVSPSGTTATASAEVDLDRSDWGVTWAKMGASVANHVVVKAQFVKA